MAVDTKKLVLIENIVGKHDISNILRELQSIDEFLKQASIRQPGTPMKLPVTGRLLEEMVQTNNLNLLNAPDRKVLDEFLNEILQTAPLLHISFAIDPSPLLIRKLVLWLRKNIHQYVILQIGLHPNIGAGCVLRTTNKYFDLSLRQKFTDQRDLLLEQLKPALQNKQTHQVGDVNG